MLIPLAFSPLMAGLAVGSAVSRCHRVEPTAKNPKNSKRLALKIWSAAKNIRCVSVLASGLGVCGMDIHVSVKMTIKKRIPDAIQRASIFLLEALGFV
tara:strand:- start:205 stop:498 length:294 start_codon:yes stop_codon:yes gene_type:complete